MKFKKLFLAAPAILLAVSCNPSTPATTTVKINKLNLGNNINSLLLGKLSTSNDTSNKLITLAKNTTNDGETTTETADEVEYTVKTTTGDQTSFDTTESVAIQSLVPLSKRFVAVQATYKDKTYALIIDLRGDDEGNGKGKCYEFPDANLFPNVKKSKISYLNHTVFQFKKRVFYYLHADENNLRKVYKLNIKDIENGTKPTVECVTPNETLTVASFAVNKVGDIAYSLYEDIITGEEEELDFEKFSYKYQPIDDSVIEMTCELGEDYLIMPLIFTGTDKCLYTYLQKTTSIEDADTTSYYVAKITYTAPDTEKSTPATAIVDLAVKDENAFTKLPSKILKFSTDSVSTIVSFAKGKASSASKYIQSIFKTNKNDNDFKPKPKDRPQNKIDKDEIAEDTVDDSSGSSLDEILDAFEGDNYLYFFGWDSNIGKNHKRHFKKIKYEKGKYTVIKDILNDYFSQLGDEAIEEVIEDSSEDVTVITEDETVVIDVDTNKEVTIEDEEGEEVSVDTETGVDVSNTDEIEEETTEE